MAKEESAEPKKSRRLRVATPTVRQRAEKAERASLTPKSDKSTKLRGAATQPFKATGRSLTIIFRPLRFLKKPLRFLAKILGLAFVAHSWQELRQVTWPNRKTTFTLTWAVIIFAIIFGAFIALTDFGLDKLSKYIFTS